MRHPHRSINKAMPIDAKLLIQYKNGNCIVRLFEDGTKERMTIDDEFHPAFPESMDLKITNYCDAMCPMCHENSSTKGAHGDLNAPFLDTLHPGMELAIGGGNPLSHPGLEDFLQRMKGNGIIANMTINEKHLLLEMDRVKRLMDQKLIHGLGLSLSSYDERTFAFALEHPNSVLHFILGIVSEEDLLKVPKGLKALFLGYKVFGRGKAYYNEEIESKILQIRHYFSKIIPHFTHIAFDNLALEQLRAKDHIPPAAYERFFMGNDGEFTMYADLVKREYAQSSTSIERYPIKDDIDGMFADIRNKRTA